ARAMAVPLPAGTLTATISSLDDDYYLFQNPAADGGCTLTYTVPFASSQQIGMGVYDADGVRIDESEFPRSGPSQTLSVEWKAGDKRPATLWIAAFEEECTTYQVTCHSP